MRHVIVTALSTLALAAGIGSAGAWERHVTVETPHGTVTGSAEVYCFNGACYREAELTGVNGYTLKRSGMCVKVAEGEQEPPAGSPHHRQLRFPANQRAWRCWSATTRALPIGPAYSSARMRASSAL